MRALPAGEDAAGAWFVDWQQWDVCGRASLSWSARTWPVGFRGYLSVSALALVQGLFGDLGVEAQAWSWSVAELDRAELLGVLVDPGAGQSEMAGELAGVHEVPRRRSALVVGLGLVV